MTVMAEPEVKQKRFFCENCKQELFLSATYCDNCGGKIEWPEKYEPLHSEAESESDDESPLDDSED
jgi:hypothetical protein